MIKIRLAALAAAAFFSSAVTASAGPSWSDFRDDRYGVAILYPSGMFAPSESKNAAVNLFATADGKAKFVVGAWANDKGQNLDAFRRSLLKDSDRYGDLTYRPSGSNWFVLSGYRGGDVYYEKVKFSCGGGIVNVFAISYPVSDRGRYDGVVERMEDSFTASRSCGEVSMAPPRD